jgi:tetratricopeptide (TPR) repeat protein
MPKSAKKSSVFFVYFVLALSTLAVFWQVHNFDFVNYDDNLYVYENSHILTGLTLDNIVWVFTAYHVGNWHPITGLSLMLDCQLFGPNPGRIHLVNVFFHIINTLLLFAVLKKMTGSLWLSAFVAAAFALHPMHVESVAWIAERKDVLSTFFFMLTLLAYYRYTQQQNKGRYFLALLTFAFGLMAKPMLVTLPFVLLLLDYWPLNRIGYIQKKKTDVSQKSFGYLVLEKLPFFVLAAVSSVITFLVQRSSGVVIGTNILPLGSRIANAFLSYSRYISKLFWPQNLAAFYPFDLGNFASWQIMLCALLLITVSVLVIYFGRKRKYLPVGWFWFVGMLVPVIGLVQVAEQSMADRYTYIPYIGLFIILAWGLADIAAKWPYRKIILGTSATVVLLFFGVIAHQQVSYWKNSYTLFSHTLEATQNNYLAHGCLAEYFRKQQNNALVIEHCKKVVEIKPNYAEGVLALGCALGEQGSLDEAINYFQKTLLLNPKSAVAYYNLGIALKKQGNFTAAIAHLNQAVLLMPDYADAHYSLANALMQQGRLDDAVDHFRTAVRLKTGWLEPEGILAWLIAAHPEIKDRDVNEAIRLAGHTCELTNYRDPLRLATLAAAYAAAGRFPEAVETAQKALNLVGPNNKDLRRTIQGHLDLYKASKPYIELPR